MINTKSLKSSNDRDVINSIVYSKLVPRRTKIRISSSNLEDNSLSSPFSARAVTTRLGSHIPSRVAFALQRLLPQPPQTSRNFPPFFDGP